MQKWPELVQTGLDIGASDHRPILLKTDDVNWGSKTFCTLNYWSNEVGFDELVRREWTSLMVLGYGSYILQEKLKLLRAKLSLWNKIELRMVENQLTTFKTILDELDNMAEQRNLSAAENDLRQETWLQLQKSLHKKESILMRKSRATWIKDGDGNNRYFLAKIISNRRRNYIGGLYFNGTWTEDVAEVKAGITSHFAAHYASESWLRPSLNLPASTQLTEIDNGFPTQEFSEEEIKETVWSCEVNKSPGPDGFNFHFIRSHWNTLKDDFILFIQEFQKSSKLTKGMNSTFIALAPKISSPSCLDHYRPISLVGCGYKILSKLLANRLKKVLAKLISKNQTTFLAVRQILDGVLAANEVIHEAKKSKRSTVLFKVDLAKAFDTVDWNFLLSMLSKMGFCQTWIRWIQECITTPHAAVLINGSSAGEFKLRKGLRQGDPLSSFLFLVVVEGLNLLINRAVVLRKLAGVTVGDVVVSHLQYADDTLIFT